MHDTDPTTVRDVLVPALTVGSVIATTTGAALTWGTGPALIALGSTTLLALLRGRP